MTSKSIAAIVCATLFASLSSGQPQQQSSGSVRYIPAAQVASTLAKGGTLVEREGHNYAVLAAHRDKPGEAELHTLDTDIVYVVQGSAELVTGGSMVEPRNTSQEEVRSSTISGGDAHSLSKGDVITVPPGMPHWFRQVTPGFDYLVVKVR